MEEVKKDMTPKLIKDLGMRFATEHTKHKYRYGLYECQYCGRHWECMTASIKRYSIRGCGCQRGKGFKHGLDSNRFYKKWSQMIRRCTEPKDSGYEYYGARGISVCAEWHNPKNFLAWCEATHPNIEGVTLDRIDNDGNYNPNNCRWADATTQAVNRRLMKNNTSGFIGVVPRGSKWVAKVSSKKETAWLGTFSTKEEAALARDNYIIENKLPHKLSTEY